MKQFLILAICLISFSSFSQEEEYDEDDTLDFYREYHILDYKKWTETIFEPTEENREWDALTKVTYNPYVNSDVLDSILSWRILEGCKPIKINYKVNDKKTLNNMSWVCMDISKSDSDMVTLGRFEDMFPDCDCANSITSIALDDSTIYVNGKNEITFKSYLLSNQIKRIEVYYYQVSRREDPEVNEEHLIIKIKKKFRLFENVYNIF